MKITTTIKAAPSPDKEFHLGSLCKLRETKLVCIITNIDVNHHYTLSVLYSGGESNFGRIITVLDRSELSHFYGTITITSTP